MTAAVGKERDTPESNFKFIHHLCRVWYFPILSMRKNSGVNTSTMYIVSGLFFNPLLSSTRRGAKLLRWPGGLRMCPSAARSCRLWGDSNQTMTTAGMVRANPNVLRTIMRLDTPNFQFRNYVWISSQQPQRRVFMREGVGASQGILPPGYGEI